MTPPRFPSKPPAPSIHPTLGQAVVHARGLTRRLREDQPAEQREVVGDMLKRLDLPKALQDHLKRRHGIKPTPD